MTVHRLRWRLASVLYVVAVMTLAAATLGRQDGPLYVVLVASTLPVGWFGPLAGTFVPSLLGVDPRDIPTIIDAMFLLMWGGIALLNLAVLRLVAGTILKVLRATARRLEGPSDL